MLVNRLGNYQATYFNAPPDNDTNDQPDQSTPLVQITSVRSLSGVGPGIEALQNGGTSSRECHICQKVFSHGLKLCAHLTGDYVTNNKQLFCSICSTKWDTLSQVGSLAHILGYSKHLSRLLLTFKQEWGYFSRK